MNKTRPLLAVLVAAFALASGVRVAGRPDAARPTPLSASVMVFNEWGLRDAPRAVEQAAKHGHRRVNFVVTIHCRLDKDLKVQDYGLILAKEGWHYTPFDGPLLARFRRQLERAFVKAVELKMDIAILPHVDAGGPVFGWRNRFDLDPLKNCRGYSYKQVMIDTLADALAGCIRENTQVEFALTGEMGRTVFAYPDAYRQIISELRRRERLKHMRTGVSINFTGVSGRSTPTKAEGPGVQKLIEASDFLGFSCYGAVSVPPKAQDFQRTVEAFLAEMEQQGVRVPRGMELHFSEVGVGGGGQTADFKDIGMAKEPAEAARSPWAGTDDPKKNPWTTAAMRGFRRDYYRALLDFLQTQPGPRRVAAAYLWDTGSWCPYGFDAPAFADREITEMIRRHNDAIGGKGRPATKGRTRAGG